MPLAVTLSTAAWVSTPTLRGHQELLAPLAGAVMAEAGVAESNITVVEVLWPRCFELMIEEGHWYWAFTIVAGATVVRCDVAPEIAPVVLIPLAERTATGAARAALPASAARR